ncbi:hypothetical protein GQ607_014440 [Colletotrichum asianum]|uniref:Uncharacterized protein n=1 Tax=Colletotrichum asianum TaxID=702518 RepID=A0A8H3W1Q7_9PEZI|nr:hypothetical protein GQ607_014440 [Colletotrichum asianum]
MSRICLSSKKVELFARLWWGGAGSPFTLPAHGKHQQQQQQLTASAAARGITDITCFDHVLRGVMRLCLC